MRGSSCWLVVAGLLLSGCTAATASTPPGRGPTAVTASVSATPVPTPAPPRSAIPTSAATATPSPTPAATPTPRLPVEPVLLGTSGSINLEVYDVAVAPLPAPMDQASAEARAEKIGALVGLRKPRLVWNLVEYPDEWHASWDSSIQGIPIDPAYDGILLDMSADGSVLSFVRTIGPLAQKPKHVLTKAQALKAAGATRADTVELVWAFRPNGSSDLRLAWYLDWQNKQPDGEKWPCVLYLDAGTGEQLFQGCVS